MVLLLSDHVPSGPDLLAALGDLDHCRRAANRRSWTKIHVKRLERGLERRYKKKGTEVPFSRFGLCTGLKINEAIDERRRRLASRSLLRRRSV